MFERYFFTYAVFAISFQAQVGHVDFLCVTVCVCVCGICLLRENRSKSMPIPLLCFAVPSLATSFHWSALSFPLRFLFFSHTLFPLYPWSPLTVSLLCVCQPDVMHKLAHCMLEAEECSEAVQCFLLIRGRLTYSENLSWFRAYCLLDSPVACHKSCLGKRL